MKYLIQRCWKRTAVFFVSQLVVATVAGTVVAVAVSIVLCW